MGPAFQIAGALLVLAGFAAAQFGYLDVRSYRYLIVNFIGAGILAVDAYEEEQWGFLLLEAVWSIVALWGLVARLLGREPAAGH